MTPMWRWAISDEPGRVPSGQAITGRLALSPWPRPAAPVGSQLKQRERFGPGAPGWAITGRLALSPWPKPAAPVGSQLLRTNPARAGCPRLGDNGSVGALALAQAGGSRGEPL